MEADSLYVAAVCAAAMRPRWTNNNNDEVVLINLCILSSAVIHD